MKQNLPAERFGWRYDPHLMTLTYMGPSYPSGYEIDLETCRTSAEVLDWVFQIHDKDWGDAALAGLLWWLRALLDPQATLCSDGVERGPIRVAALLR